MEQQNALSRRPFRKSYFGEPDYKFNMQPGDLVATVASKRWSKRKEQIIYIRTKRQRKAPSSGVWTLPLTD